MDFDKKARFSLEPLEMREVPAVLGQFVELPYVAAPEAEAVQAAPVALGKGGEEYLKIKLDDVLVVSYRETASPSIKIDVPGLVNKKLDPAPDTAKVQTQDFSFMINVNKASPTLG
jgi:type VI protein secretion system component Hcp